MPAERDSTTTAQPIKKRVQLQYLQFDFDFFHKPKIIAVKYKFGAGGLVALMDCLCKMAKGTDAEIPVDCARALCEQYEIADPDAFITYCLSLQIFEVGSSDLYITNSRVAEDQENVARKQEDWRNKKRQQRDICGTTAGSVNTEDLNTEDLKKEEKEIAKQLSTITPEAFNAVKRWAAHRKKLCLSFDSMAAEALQMQYAGRSDALIRDINASITANSRNIFQAPLREEERIKIAATAKAEVLKPVEPQRPKPKPIAPLSEPIEPIKPETMAECRRKIQEITRLATPKVSM